MFGLLIQRFFTLAKYFSSLCIAHNRFLTLKLLTGAKMLLERLYSQFTLRFFTRVVLVNSVWRFKERRDNKTWHKTIKFQNAEEKKLEGKFSSLKLTSPTSVKVLPTIPGNRQGCQVCLSGQTWGKAACGSSFFFSVFPGKSDREILPWKTRLGFSLWASHGWCSNNNETNDCPNEPCLVLASSLTECFEDGSQHKSGLEEHSFLSGCVFV